MVVRLKRYDERELEGVGFRKTSKGYVVLRLEHTADPDKRDPSWLEGARRAMPDDNTFRREFLLDWTSSSGEAYYPEYVKVKHLIEKDSTGLMPGAPIYRSWDFGQRKPACIWAQFSPEAKQLFYMREVMPNNVSTYMHRDLVLYLSGEFPYDDLHPRVKAFVEWLERHKKYPSTPWFSGDGGPQRFVDISGPECDQIQSNVPDDTPERTAAQILRASGIELRVWNGRVKARTDVIRHLMRERKDGTCGMFIDTACPILRTGLNGGIAYPKGTKLNPMPTDPARDGWHEHVHDAAGYLAVSLIDISDAPAPDLDEVVGYADRVPYTWREVERERNTLGFKETRKDIWSYREDE